jgi:hypothetical protein
MTDLVERLRRKAAFLEEGHEFFADEIADEFLLSATEIETLRAEVVKLNAECERAWRSHAIAHEQAMANGQALAEARAQISKIESASGQAASA